MTCTIARLKPHFVGSYFTKLANDAYYTRGGEPAGRWWGEGARALGLSGKVSAEVFSEILRGMVPDGRSPKGHRNDAAESHRVPGYDLTFSVPKSISAWWAVSPPEVQRQIEIAIDEAIHATLHWLETNIPLARRGRGGYLRQFAELVVAEFDHATARVAKGKGFEPQWHRHCIIANICRGQDGRWSGVNSRVLHEWTRSLGPMFRANLAEQLQQRFGVELVRPKDARGQDASWSEIAAVPERLCKRWSSRREVIEELLEGSTGLGARWSRAQAREKANLASRASKQKIPPRAELFARWQDEAKQFGFDADKVRGRNAGEVDREAVFRQAWKTTTAELDRSQSTFTYREAVQRVCEAVQTQGVAGGWLADRLAKELRESPNIRLVGEIQGEMRYSSQATWREEQKLLGEIAALQSSAGATASRKAIDRALADHPSLLPEQQAAARQLLTTPGAVRALAGNAGTGKSYTLDVVRNAFERSGYRVIGAALAGVAKEELAAKSGIESRTIASYLHHFNKTLGQKLRERVRHDARQLIRAIQGKKTFLPHKVTIDRKTVLVVDEAGMIDTRSFRQLCEVVRQKGGTIIFVGDKAQLQPIAAGGPFRHLLDQLSPARLTTNLRQRDAADRRAVEDLRAGAAQQALANYADRERLVIAKDRGEAIHQLVDAWAQRGGAERPEQHAIFAPTRAEAQVANRYCQAERITRGAIDDSRSIPCGDDRFCLGDRVLFHKNVFADGIRNGYRGVITAIDRFRGRVSVHLDGERNPRTVSIRLRDYGPDGVTLQYAQTVHKGQGQTVDHAYLLVGGKMADREMIYVQGTRGKLSTQLFVDEAHAGTELRDLARSLARSRPKELAHDLAKRAVLRPEIPRPY